MKEVELPNLVRQTVHVLYDFLSCKAGFSKIKIPAGFQTSYNAQCYIKHGGTH
jgi:hypothetical protein